MRATEQLLARPGSRPEVTSDVLPGAWRDAQTDTTSEQTGVRAIGQHNAYLVVATDEPSGRAAGRLLTRTNGGPLQIWHGAIRAIRVTERGRSGILAGPLDTAIGQPVEAGLAAWEALGATGAAGDLVVVVLRTVKRSDDLAVFRASVEQVGAAFVAETLPIRLLAVAVLLRPPDRLDLRSLRGLDGLALPPILVNLFTPSGPLPTDLVPDALAEWLEVLVSCGPAALLGAHVPTRPAEQALVVALDAVEAPDSAEAAYLHTLVLHRWLGDLLQHDPAPRIRQVAPAEATARSVTRIVAGADADQQGIGRAAEAACRDAVQALEGMAEPRLLRSLPRDEQRTLVETQNHRAVGPLRDQLFRRVTDTYARAATLSGLARTEAHRLIGNFHGGIGLAESCLAEAVTRLEDRHRATDEALPGHSGPCDEPSLAIDPDETDELAPIPRGAPWRTTFGWLALLGGGLASLAASLPPLQNPPDWLVAIFGDDAGVAERALLLIAPLALGIMVWQLACWAMLRLEGRKVAAQPIHRYRQRLAIWRSWLLRHGLPARQAEEAARELDRIQLLRERLQVLVEHLAAELVVVRARLIGPAFPRVLARRATTLEELEQEVVERWDVDRVLRMLGERWRTGDDLAAFGARLAELLESMVLQAGPLTADPQIDDNHTDRQVSGNDDEALHALAWKAVAEEFRTRRRESLDERLGRPVATLVQMLGRAVPVGAAYAGAGRVLVGDPESRLAQVAAEAGLTRFERSDHQRAALIVVSAMRL